MWLVRSALRFPYLILVLTLAVVFWAVPLGIHGLWRQGSSTSELEEQYEALE